MNKLQRILCAGALALSLTGCGDHFAQRLEYSGVIEGQKVEYYMPAGGDVRYAYEIDRTQENGTKIKDFCDLNWGQNTLTLHLMIVTKGEETKKYWNNYKASLDDPFLVDVIKEEQKNVDNFYKIIWEQRHSSDMNWINN
jgi:hypothetical protein